MSPEVNQKSKTLRNVTIMLLLVLVAILIIGIFTRPDQVPINAHATTQDQISDLTVNTSEISQELQALNNRLDDIQDSLNQIQESLDNLETTPLQLTGPALYASYIDEIVTTIYPDLQEHAEFIKAMIYHESRYQPDVTNVKTGVQGLMQISPKWHTKRADSLGVTDLFDPYGNVLVGCDILNEAMQYNTFDYAVNVFAGGYTYADQYKNSASPYIKAVNGILRKMQNGEIVLGGE